jgi:LysM repeat protein
VMAGSTLLMSIPIAAQNASAATQPVEGQMADSASKNPPQLVSASANAPRIVLDGTWLNVQATIINNQTYIPIRAIAETLGAQVHWNHDTRTVLIRQGGMEIRFAVGSTQANVNGRTVTTPASVIQEGTALVPLRFVSETLGLQVAWNNETRTVQLLTPVTVTQSSASASFYTVATGDSLWSIAKRFNTSVDALKQANRLPSDVLQSNQELVIPKAFHQVTMGQSLWSIAKQYGVTVDAIKAVNPLSGDVLKIGQALVIPATVPTPSVPELAVGSTVPTIATTTVPAIAPTTEPATSITPADGNVRITYTTHTARSGDNMWNLSQLYGLPYLELLKVNHMTESSWLSVGQVIQVPIYNVPVKAAVSQKHGELLDWWTEARYVFSTGKEATITDFATGRSFQVKHTMGGNHADSEPLTARDAEIMKEVWGDSYSWTPRAIIVEVDGRRLAAAMHSMPHGTQAITGNNYEGHFCIHFLNSQRHSDGKVQDTMQRQVMIAAGQ